MGELTKDMTDDGSNERPGRVNVVLLMITTRNSNDEVWSVCDLGKEEGPFNPGTML